MRSATYKTKSMGPSTEPWGTPHSRQVTDDLALPRRTHCDRPDKYEWNHACALSVIAWLAIYFADVLSLFLIFLVVELGAISSQELLDKSSSNFQSW